MAFLFLLAWNIREEERKRKDFPTNGSCEMLKRTNCHAQGTLRWMPCFLSLTNRPFVPILPVRMERTRRWYGILLSLVALWCLSIVGAPLARIAGAPAIVPDFLYAMFSRVCHQFPDRTFHLAGEPFGVCIRCSAIYFGFFATLVAYPFLRGISETSVPSRWVLIAGLAPMALDVVLNFFGLHASSVLTRVVSGSLAGVILPFFVVPPLLEALNKFLVSGEPLDARQTQ